MTYEKWQELAEIAVLHGKYKKTWGIFVGDETPNICNDVDVAEYLGDYEPAGYMAESGFIPVSADAVRKMQSLALLPYEYE